MKEVLIDSVPITEFVLDLAKVKKNVQRVVEFTAGYEAYEITLLIVRDAEMLEINRERRGIDNTTDVLTFPVSDESVNLPFKILGEVVICIDALVRQATEIGHGELDEFYRLLVHGILHLFGYDHETNAKDERRMKKKEDECLELIFR